MNPFLELDQLLERLNFDIGVRFCGFHADVMWEFELLRREVRKRLV